MLVSAPAHMVPAKLVQHIEGQSSRRLQDEFPELSARQWGAVDEATVKAYTNQRWDEDDDEEPTGFSW
jgi:REP element-mobilizing transposase RayT